ncbi:MAG TPA: response regulator [Deltaproteobacteria bacterium]|nr:response regulator [Deltaproteobacteria bacterium]
MAKIWIADDDLFYRKLISEALIEQGHQVWTMHNGLNIMHLLFEDPPDLLILDVFMAQKNGVELLTEINRVSETKGMKRMPVIVISGDDSISTELAVRKAKANRFLLKPFQKEEIVRVVNDLLELSKERAKAQS